jgi:hypothetical protein
LGYPEGPRFRFGFEFEAAYEGVDS